MLEQHYALRLDTPGTKAFCFAIERDSVYGLYTEHFALEFNLRLIDAEGNLVPPLTERNWIAEHEHDDEVRSIGIETIGDVNAVLLNLWLSQLLSKRGADIFRMKGFISIADNPERFVFQGVHMLFDGQPDRPWGEEPRCNQLVFIGRNLDRDELEDGFRACLV